MKAQTTGLRVAAIVFALIALAQLLRFVMRLDVVVASNVIPLWPSAVAVIIAGGLSIWLWWLASTNVTQTV